LAASASLGVVTFGTLPISAAITPVPSWQQTTVTKELAAKLHTSASLVKEHGVHALDAAQWEAFGNDFARFGDWHSRLMNLRHADIAVAVNQAALKNRLGTNTINKLLADGTAGTLYSASVGYGKVATMLRGGAVTFELTGAPLGGPIIQVRPGPCTTFWLLQSLTAIALSILIPELGILFALMGGLDDIIGAFSCG